MSLVVPSCGQTLLRGPAQAFDYVLHVTDGQTQFRMNCHRCVLSAHSLHLSRLITGENFFSLSIKVQVGYLGALSELIQYMYLKDIRFVTDKTKVMELCALFEMPSDHFCIRKASPLTLRLSQTPIVLHIGSTEDNACLSHSDFLKVLHFEKSKIQSTMIHRVEMGTQTESPPAPKKKRKKSNRY